MDFSVEDYDDDDDDDLRSTRGLGKLNEGLYYYHNHVADTRLFY